MVGELFPEAGWLHKASMNSPLGKKLRSERRAGTWSWRDSPKIAKLSAVFWADHGQATACHYLFIWGLRRKAWTCRAARNPGRHGCGRPGPSSGEPAHNTPCSERQELALFANSLRCNGASAAEGRPSVARLASSRQPVTQTGHKLLTPDGASCTARPSVSHPSRRRPTVLNAIDRVHS